MTIAIEVERRATIRDPSRLPPALLADLRSAFTYENPEYAKLQSLGLRRRVPRFLSTYEIGDDGISFPRGGLDRVRSILDGHGFGSLEIIDQRATGDRSLGRIPPHRVNLWPFQEELAHAAIESETCLLRAPQGSGKTTAALAIAARIGLPTLVIVSTTNLLDQWVRRCVNELGISEDEVGYIQGGKVRVRAITIAMQQTLRTHARRIARTFGTVIADEVQLFAASTFQNVIDVLAAKYRIGVSGDERRADRKEFLVYDQFGSIAAEVSHSDMVSSGYVHDVEIRVVPTSFDAPWFTRLREPRQRIRAMERLFDAMISDSERNAIVLECIRACVEAGEQVIVLSNRREHCHRIDSLATGSGYASGLFIGGQDYRHVFESTLRGVKNGQVRVAVGTYQAIGIGFDAPRVSRGVCSMPVANSSKGEFQWKQYRGRFARTCEGKRNAILYYIHDPKVFGQTPIRNLARWNNCVRVWDPKILAWIAVRRSSNGKTQKRREESGSVRTTANYRPRSSAGKQGNLFESYRAPRCTCFRR